MSFWRSRQLAFFTSLIFLSLVAINFQHSIINKWHNSTGPLSEKANNLVAIQADVPDDYRGFGAGGVYCQDPGKPLIGIPGAVVSFDGPHSVPAGSGYNIPNPIPPKYVTTINNGSFTTGAIADSLGVSVNTLWLALKNGWWKPNVRFVRLPQTLPAAITNPNFRNQTPTAQWCNNGALGLCKNSNLCGGGNTFYQSCDMSGLTDQQGLERLGGFVFLYTNCAAVPTPTPTKTPTPSPSPTKTPTPSPSPTKTPTPSPTPIPACLSAKLQIKSGTSWIDYNSQNHQINVGDLVRFSVTGRGTSLNTAKFYLIRETPALETQPITINNATRTVSGSNVTFTADYTISTAAPHRVTAEVFQ